MTAKVDMIRSGNKGRRWGRRLVTPALALVLAIGCQDEQNTSFQGSLVIKLVDAPAAFDELNIVFTRVSIHRAGTSIDLGWRIVSDDVLTQDILELRNGVSRNIVSTTVPEGSYDRIRILFNTSSLRQDGFESAVFIPDELFGGVDFEHPFDVAEGKTTGITFDFDATRSVKADALGRFELRPIVRIQNTDIAGSIIGAVVPDSVRAIVSTATETDSVTTSSLAQPGNNSFELVDLPEGSYTVTILPGDAAYRDTSIAGITVVRRQKTNIGAIPLRLK